MQNILGIVKVVIGQVFAVAVDGTQRELHEGDRIFAGEEIVTGANGALTVNLSDGHTMDIGRNSHWSSQGGLSANHAEHATDNIAALQQAIADGVDPTKTLDATAAGNEAPIQAGEGGGGHFIERVELTGEVLDVTSGFATNGLGSPSPSHREFDTYSPQQQETQPALAESVLAQTITASMLTDSVMPVSNLTPSVMPMQTLTDSVMPMQTLTDSVMPVSNLTPSVMPMQTLTDSVMPMSNLTPSVMPMQTLTDSVMPMSDLTPSVMPMQTLTDSVMPMSNLTPSVMPMQTLTDSVMPVSNLTPSVMPMQTLTDSVMPVSNLTPSVMPMQTLTDSVMPMTDLTPSVMPMQTLTDSVMPMSNLTPSVMPMQTLTDSVMPVSNLTPSVMPMQTLTDSVMPVSNLTPSVMPMQTLTDSVMPVSELTPSVMPMQTLTDSVMPVSELTPSVMPMQMFTDSVMPMSNLTPSVMPMQTLTDSVMPVSELTPSVMPMHTLTDSVMPVSELTPSVMPMQTLTDSVMPVSDLTPSVMPMQTLTDSVMPVSDLTPSVMPMQTLTDSVMPVSDLTPSVMPMQTLTDSVMPVSDLTPSVMPMQTLTDSVMPVSELTPSVMPMQTLTDSVMPVSDLTPSVMPMQTLTDSVMPVSNLTPSVMPMHTLTDSVMPLSNLTPSVMPMQTLTDSVMPVSDLTLSVMPVSELTPSVMPMQTLTDSVMPVSDLTPSVMPMQTLTDSVMPLSNLTPSVMPMQTLTDSVMPVSNLTPSVMPMQTLTDSVMPMSDLTPSVMPMQTLTDSVMPMTDLTPSVMPMQTLTDSVMPTSELTPSVMPMQTLTDSVMPVSDLTPSVMPMQTLTDSVMPVSNLTPSVMPMQTLTDSVMPVSNLTPSVMPMQTLTDSVMPLSNLTPSVMPMQTLTDSVMPVSDLTSSTMPMSDLTLSTKITIDSLEPIETPDSNETSGSVTHVNGGSHSPDGFDVQNGNITAIGSNVHIWLSDGDTRPECANPDDQINYYHDGNPHGDGEHTDVFVAHPGSGYTTHQGGNQPIDIQQYLNAIHGDGQQAAGKGHSDYIFLPDRTGLDDTYTNTQGNSNNANVNVNTLDNISIGGSNGVDHNLSLSGVNGIEGIIFGDGSQPYLANNQRTEITSTHAPVAEPEVMVSGTVSGDVEAGDSVDLLVNDHIYHGTVVELADGHLGYHIAVKVADINAGHEVHATLTATDDAGNPFTATADHTFNVDDASEGSAELDTSTAADVDLVIDPVTGDDVINHHESQDKTTDISGTVTGDAREGDDVVVTVGGVSYGSHLFMQNNGELGFRIPVNTGYLVAGQGVHVQVTTTDEAGNTTILMEQDHTVKTDLSADATITIDNTNPDVIVDEDGHSTSMITGEVSGEARVGDIVHLNVHDNNYTGTVVDLGDGHLGYRIPVNTGDLAAGYSISARIDVTDNAGNTTTATAEHAITQDVPASAPTHNDDAITHNAPVAMENPKPVTHVNGGSGSADGFDVQEGKIVAVGSNVHLWISEGDLIPKCANPDEQIKHYGNNNGGGNPQGDGSHTDVFVVHQGSGYLQDGSHRELNAINGTTQQVDGGHKDYIFVQDGTESDYHFSFGSNNNANSNVNTLENVSVTGTNNDAGQGLHLQGVNHIEGIIFGDGSAHTANDSRTSIVHSDSHLEGTQTPPDVDHHALANLIENTDNIFHAAPSPETTTHREISAAPGWQPEHPSVGDTAEKVNLSDLAHELENGTDITSLIKGAGQGSGEVAHTVADAHIVSPVMSEPAVIDSVAHSSFDHLLAKPEHHY